MKTKWLKAFRSLKPATAIAGTVKYVIPFANKCSANAQLNVNSQICLVSISCDTGAAMHRTMGAALLMAKTITCRSTHTRRLLRAMYAHKCCEVNVHSNLFFFLNMKCGGTGILLSLRVATRDKTCL